MILYVIAIFLMGCGLVMSRYSDYYRYDQIAKLSIKGKEFSIDRSVMDVGFGPFYSVNLRRFHKGSRTRGHIFSISYSSSQGFVLEKNPSFFNQSGRDLVVENHMGKNGQEVILGPNSRIKVFFEEKELDLDFKMGV